MRAIEVEYEPLPVVAERPVRDPARHASVREGPEEYDLPNVCDHAVVTRGDIQQGFAAADLIFENTYETPWVHQGYLEPHTSVAEWDEASGKMTVWTSTQAQFSVRSAVAGALELAMSRVRVVGMAVGGGFGGKGSPILEPITAALARRCRRPVKMVMTREEEFLANRPCGGSVVELKTGARQDGTLVALEARLLFDTGAYRGAQTGTGAELVQGPYRIPNLSVKAYGVYTNKPSAGARHALTGPHVHFAIESQMDSMAHTLGLDPLELRLRNVMGKGDPVTGGTMPYSLPEKVIRAAAGARDGRSDASHAGAGTECVGSGSRPGTGRAGPRPRPLRCRSTTTAACRWSPARST